MVFGTKPASETPGPPVTSGGLFGRSASPRGEESDDESKPKAEDGAADIKLGRGQSNEGKIVNVSLW